MPQRGELQGVHIYARTVARLSAIGYQLSAISYQQSAVLLWLITDCFEPIALSLAIP
jgi:hypothetical protein